MKANELMIGDWVQNTCGHKGKVIGFRYDTTDKDNEIVIAYNSNSTTWSQSSLIEPIPLTEEILKANGFADNGELPSKDHIKINRYKDDGWFVTFCECYGYDINYVHELQHALRICGLNELADNFKIMEE